MKPIPYIIQLSTARLILWCYLTWYLIVVVRYFDPAPRLWLTSVGLSGIIGTALYLSTTAAGVLKGGLGFWPCVRLFLMPFCVSSFAALVKDRGFILVFSPRLDENLLAIGVCGVVWASVRAAQWQARRREKLRVES